VRKVIDGGNFALDQLWSITKDPRNWLLSNTDNRVVIYLFLFKDIDGVEGNDGVGLYGGKTINAGQRRACHEVCLLNPTEPGHICSFGPKTKACRMLIISDLSTLPLQKRDRILCIAEHTCVSLFRSWKKLLLTPEFQDTAEVAKYYFDATMAKAFCDIADKVFEKTNWKPCPGRGLNWKTPLTEKLLSHTSLTCQVFTLDEETGPVRAYRSGPKRLYELQLATGEKYHVFDLLRGGSDHRGKVQLTVNLSAGVEHPTTIHLVVEIHTGSGKRHPVPCARLPEPGPFTSWDELNAWVCDSLCCWIIYIMRLRYTI
jgi:hypothetical protein